MNKLELIAKAILADVKNPDISDEQKMLTIVEDMKVYAVESLNLLQYLKENNIAPEVIIGLMATQGFDFDGRTKKFK